MDSAIPSQDVETFALEWAWDELCDYGYAATAPSRSGATRALMAARIEELVRNGVRDQFWLASDAIAAVLVSTESPSLAPNARELSPRESV
jgi:hypothetical protein